MIDQTYVHLLLNHVPVLTSLLGIPLLLYGWLRKEEQTLKIGLAFFVLAAISALPVYFSGEGAEEAVEHLPGVLESLIESHEDAAKISMVLIELLGLSSLIAFLTHLRKPELSKFALPILTFISLGSAGSIAYTAHLGGQIRHSEIRGNSGQSSNDLEQEKNNSSQNKHQEHEEEHDDD